MAEEVKHITVNGKYRVVYEQTATAKGVIGFKIEANGDDMETTLVDAHTLLESAKKTATAFSSITDAK